MANWFKQRGHDVTVYYNTGKPVSRNGPLHTPVEQLATLQNKPLPDILVAAWTMHPEWFYKLRARTRLWLMISYRSNDLARAEKLPDWTRICVASKVAEKCRREHGIRAHHVIVGGVDLEQFRFAPMTGRNDLVVWRDRSVRYDRAADLKLLGRELNKVALPNREMKEIRADRIPALFRESRLFLMFEMRNACWCNPVAEAMASGCPVIAVTHDAVADLVLDNETGWLAKDATEAVKIAQRVRHDEKKLAAIAERARSHVEQFSYARWCTAIEQVILRKGAVAA